MNSRGAAILGVASIGFTVLVGATSGPRTFSRVYATSPVVGTGSSGSALAFRPDLDVGWFGDCSDGDATISVSASIGRDMFYRNLTIAAGGVTLTSAGYAIYVCQTLTFGDAGSTIANNGNPGVLRTNGAALAAGTLPGGRRGGQGSQSCVGPAEPGNGPNPGIPREVTTTAAGGAGTVTVGANGANGGIGEGGGGGGGGGDGTHTGGVGATTPGATIVAANGDPREIWEGMTGHVLASSTPWGDSGGASGGGNGGATCNTVFGGDGGGAGGGAGWVVVGARAIVGPGVITAIGGAGGAGGCPVQNVGGFPVAPGSGTGGGGGGGPGGRVVVTTETGGWNNVNVSGGAGGSGFCFSANAGGNGGHGGSGIAIINPVRQP